MANDSANFSSDYNATLAAIWQQERIKSVEWIVAETISCITTMFAVYLVFALFCYELKKRGYTLSRSSDPNDYSTGGGTTDSPTKSVEHDSPKKGLKPIFKVRRTKKPNHEERYETWLRGLNILAAFYAMLKCFSLQLDLQLGTTTDQLCTGFAFTSVICNGSSFLSVYLLLWLRQWAVHSHPALQHLPVKKLRRLSWILLGAIIITFISLCVMFFITLKVAPGPRGCVFADEGTISQGARSGSGIIFTALFQPALLALLFYPLMKHTLNRRRAFGGGEGKHSIAKPQDESEAKIYVIIKRLLISLFLCTISDIGGVIGAFLLETFPIFYISLVYDLNITFGSYVIVWSFNDWRKRLFPFCYGSKKTNDEESVRETRPSSTMMT